LAPYLNLRNSFIVCTRSKNIDCCITIQNTGLNHNCKIFCQNFHQFQVLNLGLTVECFIKCATLTHYKFWSKKLITVSQFKTLRCHVNYISSKIMFSYFHQFNLLNLGSVVECFIKCATVAWKNYCPKIKHSPLYKELFDALFKFQSLNQY